MILHNKNVDTPKAVATPAKEFIEISHINIRQSISILIMKLVLIDLIAGIGVVLFHGLLLATEENTQFKFSIDPLGLTIFLLVVLSKIALSIYIVDQWVDDYYEIRPDKITHRSGLIFKHEVSYLTTRIRSIHVRQSFLGKLLNYGTISIFDWDLNKYVYLYQIHNPMRYAHVLKQIIPSLDEEKHTVRDKIIEEDID